MDLSQFQKEQNAAESLIVLSLGSKIEDEIIVEKLKVDEHISRKEREFRKMHKFNKEYKMIEKVRGTCPYHRKKKYKCGLDCELKKNHQMKIHIAKNIALKEGIILIETKDF